MDRIFSPVAALVLAALAFPASAQDLVRVEGRVAVFNDEKPAGDVALEIAGELVDVAPDGTFAVELPLLPYYQLVMGGHGYYPAVQNFAHTELSDEQCQCLRIPLIEVVARREGRVELFFAGDAMAGRRYSEPVWGERQLVDPADPYPDLMRLLAPIRPYVEGADIASVNLETVLADADPGDSPPKSVVFYAPTALANALADSGFDYVSLGNNHSYDYLEAGLDTTIAAIEAAGLAWSGAGHDEVAALRPAILDAGGTGFAMLGYVGWQGNVEPNQVAEAGKGGAAFGTEENIRASVAAAAAQKLVPVVQLHGSREYSDRPTEISEERMLLAVAEGARIIASHHPHVTQGIEVRDGAIIAYSLGNFLFDQYFMQTHASFALKVWTDEGEPMRAEVIPLRILDYRPVPAMGDARQFVLDRVQRLSSERGTAFTPNGGHLVLALGADAIAGERTEAVEPETRQLVFWGDFENTRYGDALDRTLHLRGGSLDYRFDPASGTALVMLPDSGAREMTLLPSTFFRNITRPQAGFTARIHSGQPVTMELLTQQRPARTDRMEALESEPFVPVGLVNVPGGEGWQDISATFPVPVREDGSLAPFRLALRIMSDTAQGEVALDDFSVVTRAN